MLPAIMTGSNVQCVVNFGGSAFAHFPDAGASPVSAAEEKKSAPAPAPGPMPSGGFGGFNAAPGGFGGFNSAPGGFDFGGNSFGPAASSNFSFGGGGGFGALPSSGPRPTQPQPRAGAPAAAAKAVKKDGMRHC